MYDFDAIVIGGGIYGASVLQALASKGVTRTLLIDSKKLASGSTGQSAAMIRVYHRDQFLTDLALESLGAFRESARQVGFVRTGSLYFESMDRLAQVHKDVERLKDKGYRIQILGRWEAEGVCPGIRWPERSFGIWEPDAGYADPVATTLTWVQKARSRGARIMENCALESVLTEDQRVIGVRTASGDIRAKRVILASGVATSRILGDLGISNSLDSRWIQFHQFQGSGDLTAPAFFNRLDGSFGRPSGKHGALIGVAEAEPQGTQALNRLQVLRSQWVAGHTLRGLEGGTLSGAVRAQDSYAPGRRCVAGALGRYRGLFVATGGSGTGFKNAPAVGSRVAYSVLRGG